MRRDSNPEDLLQQESTEDGAVPAMETVVDATLTGAEEATHTEDVAVVPELEAASPYAFSDLAARIEREMQSVFEEEKQKREAVTRLYTELGQAKEKLISAARAEEVANKALNQLEQVDAAIALKNELQDKLATQLAAYAADPSRCSKGKLRKDPQRHYDEFDKLIIQENGVMPFFDAVIEYARRKPNSTKEGNLHQRLNKCLLERIASKVGEDGEQHAQVSSSYYDKVMQFCNLRDKLVENFKLAKAETVSAQSAFDEKSASVVAATQECQVFKELCQTRCSTLKMQVEWAGKMRAKERSKGGFRMWVSYNKEELKAENQLLADIASRDDYYEVLGLLKNYLGKYQSCKQASLSTMLLKVLLNQNYGFFGSNDPLVIHAVSLDAHSVSSGHTDVSNVSASTTASSTNSDATSTSAGNVSTASHVSIASEQAGQVDRKTNQALELPEAYESAGIDQKARMLDGVLADQETQFRNDVSVSPLLKNRNGGFLWMYHKSTEERDAARQELVDAISVFQKGAASAA